MILAAIIACEVGFWVAIGGGLITRYVFGRPRLGAMLLLAAPLIDVVLLVLVAVDLLGGGGTASWHHGLAALYIGVSVAYGHRMVAWADAKFAARFRGAAPRPHLYGTAYALACWKDVPRTVLAAAIAAVVLGRVDPTIVAATASAIRRAVPGILVWVIIHFLLETGTPARRASDHAAPVVGRQPHTR